LLKVQQELKDGVFTDDWRHPKWEPSLNAKLAAIEAKATKLRNKAVSMRIVRGDAPDGAA
jgi:hypothetical protein